jgi:hypothetical protein
MKKWVGWWQDPATGWWQKILESSSWGACEGAALAVARGGKIAVVVEGIHPGESRGDHRPVLTVGQRRPTSWPGRDQRLMRASA